MLYDLKLKASLQIIPNINQTGETNTNEKKLKIDCIVTGFFSVLKSLQPSAIS